MSSHPLPAESAKMQAYIAMKQADVLSRAMTTVHECPDSELAAQMHRLAGTLGTFQLLDAHDACRYLEGVAKRSDATAADIATARTDTLALLEQIAEDLTAADEGETPA